MIGKLAIHVCKQKMMLPRQHLDQLFNRRSCRTVARIPADAECLLRCRLGYAGNILVEDIIMLINSIPLRPVPRRRHCAEQLDIAAKKRTPLKYYFEAVIIGGVMASGYLYAAVDVIQSCFGII